MAIGRVIGECMDRHRHDEYLRFLGTIDRTVPAGAGRARDRGQLCHAQARRRQGLGRIAPKVPHALHAHNRSTCPYTWTASAETILAKVKHAKETLNHSTIYETDH